jgi:integrase
LDEDDIRAALAALHADVRALRPTPTVSVVTLAALAALLRWDQLDVRGGTISLLAAETKGKRDRATILSAWASSMILNTRRVPGSPYVFCSRRGKPYNPRTLLRHYQEAADEAGVEAAPGERPIFHHTRSGFGDAQVALGTPVPDVMAMAGWRDYRTMQRYLRRPAKAIAAAARARLEAARRGPRQAPVSPNVATRLNRHVAGE